MAQGEDGKGNGNNGNNHAADIAFDYGYGRRVDEETARKVREDLQRGEHSPTQPASLPPITPAKPTYHEQREQREFERGDILREVVDKIEAPDLFFLRYAGKVRCLADRAVLLWVCQYITNSDFFRYNELEARKKQSSPSEIEQAIKDDITEIGKTFTSEHNRLRDKYQPRS